MDECADSAEDVVLVCLRSSHQDNTSIDQLQPIGIDTYEFDDVDECVEYILSLDPEDTFVFMWLGFGWNHLIPIVHQFQQIHCIYLHEPTHHKFMSKVHGVFTHPGELLQQLVRDIRMSQESQSTHLNPAYNQETATIHNLQGNPIQAIWSEILLQGLIRMPTPSTNVYGEMIKEARYFYRNNPAQLAHIDDFEKNYRCEDAIRWYSRDAFVYRLVNKALRTQNLVILFKFRFIIRDIYEQLKKLYHKQYWNGNHKNEEPSTMKLYRAMKVSSAESKQLRFLKKGAILSINSFVSATFNEMVALLYLGNDLERDIMLEIEVDKKVLSSDGLPFADIHTLSSMSDEMEVLLSMGTTLRVESVSTSHHYRNICVQTRLSYDMDLELKELRKFTLEKQLRCGMSESSYMFHLFAILFPMNDLKRIKQVQMLCAQRNHQSLRNICQSLSKMDNLFSDLNNVDSVVSSLVEATSDAVTSINASIDQIDPSGAVRDIMARALQCLANIVHCRESNEDCEQQNQQLVILIASTKEILNLFSIPPSHPVFSSMRVLEGTIEGVRGNHEKALQYFQTAQTSSVAALFNNHSPNEQYLLKSVIKSATALGRDDYSEKILKDLHDPTKPQAHILKTLADYHMDKKDWPMAIMHYRQIIEECNLPINSILIVEAYYSIGRAFSQLADLESGLLNFNRAYQLLLQHHPPTHALVGEIKYLIDLAERQHNRKQFAQIWNAKQ